jgi:hypothetical protein
VIAIIVAVVALLLVGAGVMTYALVSGDEDQSTETASRTADPSPTEELPTLEPSPSEPTVEVPTPSAPTDPSPTDGPSVQPSIGPQAYVDVAVAYADAIVNQDCAAAKRYASDLLISSGKAVYCGDGFTRDVMADFDPSNPDVQMYEIIDTAQITFTWTGKTAFFSLTSADGVPKVDALFAY